MVSALKQGIAVLKRELKIYKVVLDNGMLASKTKSTNVTRGETNIGTCVEFQKEFNAKFYLEYAKDEA
ncbi:hypothetical protein PVK06_012107 [Gossypium arboreum]|uniref:Uncharacterized protein n=1 Tax=Gossypium arboreum TaxID=29729 RepID=A0ABR0QAN4_GOSAR|nr:hypothetical protein PVK06_012107 [Gossypium arboreum]